MGCRTSGPCPLHVPEGSAVRDRPAWESTFSSESILPMSPRKLRPPSCCDCKGTKSHGVARDPESLVFSCLLLFCPPRGSGVIFFFCHSVLWHLVSQAGSQACFRSADLRGGQEVTSQKKSFQRPARASEAALSFYPQAACSRHAIQDGSYQPECTLRGHHSLPS